MPLDDPNLISDIRAASRELVRRWGFLSGGIAGTDMSGSAVHAIIEIGRTDGLTARDLSQRLNLEKSSVSRLVANLVRRGEVQESQSRHDARQKPLHLTGQGRRTLAAVDALAEVQVRRALEKLDPDGRETVREGLGQYAAALESLKDDLAETYADLAISEGYVPGLIGAISSRTARRMLPDYPFGPEFEGKVASDLAEFIPRSTQNGSRIWHVSCGGDFMGSITIDGENLGDNRAHLRWFIMSDHATGRGLGRRLLETALQHCDGFGFDEIHLWTVRGLDVARHLYEDTGFVCADEYVGDQWGAAVTEQKFVRMRPGT